MRNLVVSLLLGAVNLADAQTPANAPLNTCSLAFGSAIGCSPVAEFAPDGTARIAVAVAPEAFGVGGGGAIAEAFFAAAAATADPGVITIVFSNSSGSPSALCVSTKRS